MRFLNYNKLFLALVILTLFVSLSCASASLDDIHTGNNIHIGDMIKFTVDNVDGCHWEVSECDGAEFLDECYMGSRSDFYFKATHEHGAVWIDLVNSNDEVIDHRMTLW